LGCLLQPGSFENVYWIAFLWVFLAFVASLISVRVGISVALLEIIVGVLAGNMLHLSTSTWIDFLADFGSVLLTFLAGAEIDPASLRRFAKPGPAIGGIGFAARFAAAWAFAFLELHWQWHASQIAGVALSTTSVAVVYAVMIETGPSKTDLGKLILTACFVCGLGTLLALGILFADYNLLLVGFGIATVIALVLLPWSLRLSSSARSAMPSASRR